MIGQHGFRCARRSGPRLATVDGQLVANRRPYARLADCDGPLFADYQRAKSAWDKARYEPDAAREQFRRNAIDAYDAWALSCGMSPINTPKSWGFN
jgi:hypothetical protein